MELRKRKTQPVGLVTLVAIVWVGVMVWMDSGKQQAMAHRGAAELDAPGPAAVRHQAPPIVQARAAFGRSIWRAICGEGSQTGIHLLVCETHYRPAENLHHTAARWTADPRFGTGAILDRGTPQ